MYADSSHANARYCYSGGYRYFSPVENSTGCIRLNKMQKKTKPYVAVKRDTQESNPEQRMLHPHYPFRVSPECKQISKGFLPSR